MSCTIFCLASMEKLNHLESKKSGIHDRHHLTFVSHNIMERKLLLLEWQRSSSFIRTNLNNLASNFLQEYSELVPAFYDPGSYGQIPQYY
jgi:hypothetical protein